MASTERDPESRAEWDVAIVGGGPAGLSAALLLARARRRVVVLDAAEQRNRFAPHMHGVLGLDGESPLGYLERGLREVLDAGGTVRRSIVAHVSGASDRFRLALHPRPDSPGPEVDPVLTARRVLVATGLRDELPDVEGLREHWGDGVVLCPYCDGHELRDRRLGVIAGDPMAAHQAQLVRQWSEDVTYFSHRAGPPPDETARAFAARGIALETRPVRRILAGADGLDGVELEDGSRVSLDAVFTLQRFLVQDALLRDLHAEFRQTRLGPLVATDRHGATSVPGVWAAGNVVTPGALVPMVAGEGVAAGLAINADLMHADVDDAVALVAAAGPAG